MFTKASIFNEVDKMTGVSANIMFGQVAPCGTNIFDLIFDEKKFMKYVGETDDTDEPIEFNNQNLTENDVNTEINNTYKDLEPHETITDGDFDFGYDASKTMEYDLGYVNLNNKNDVSAEEVVKIVNNPMINKNINVKKIRIRKEPKVSKKTLF